MAYDIIKFTAAELARLEKRIAREYANASGDLSDLWDKYINGYDDAAGVHYSSLAERAKLEKSAMEQKKYGYASMTDAQAKAHYQQWLINQMGRGERWLATANQMANRLVNANLITQRYTNNLLPKIFVANSNAVADLARKAAMEQGVTGIRFDLVDEWTVKRLMAGSREVRPYRQIEINIRKDKQWNLGKVQNALLEGILSGDSIGHMAQRFMNVSGMNQVQAVRNARTSVTGAESAGKQDRYDELKEKGCTFTKIWVATEDRRTRPEHRAADGQEVDSDEYFDVGGEELKYPGDEAGSPWNIYNCRCTMKTGKIQFHSVLSDRARQMDTIRVLDDDENDTVINPLFARREKGARITSRSVQAVDKANTANVLLDEVGFVKVSVGVKKLDGELMQAASHRLAILEKRFGAVRKSRGTELISKKTNNLGAYVERKYIDPLNETFALDSVVFKNKTSHLELVESLVTSKEYMPCAPEQYDVYMVTHEYGHMLFGRLLEEQYILSGWNKNHADAFVIRNAKSDIEAYAWYINETDKYARMCYDEIVQIAREENEMLDLGGLLSNYAKSGQEEFFAEVFANSQCGKPNAMGKAMQIWLRRKGF